MRASILIPVKNGERFLGQALDSVAAAALDTECEIVIQDALSTDRTREIVLAHAPRALYTCEEDAGQADGLNRALAQSSGEVVGWLNGDDLYGPKAVSLAVSAFEAHPLADVIYGCWNVIDERGHVLRSYQPTDWNWNRLYRKGNYIFSGATFFRRRVFERFGNFDATYNYTMDLEFFLRIGRDVSAMSLDEALGTFRIHNRSKTGSQWFGFFLENNRLRRAYWLSGDASLSSYLGAQAVNLVGGATTSLRWSKAYSSLRDAPRST